MLDNSAPMLTKLVFGNNWHFVTAGIFCLGFLLITALCILQMLIGVLCNIVDGVSKEARESHAIAVVKSELLGPLKDFDDGDGKIKQEELQSVMKDPRARAVLEHLGINRLFLLEMQALMFLKEDSVVSIEKILEMLVMCRSENPGTVEILAGGFCFIYQTVHKENEKTRQLLQTVQQELAVIMKSTAPRKG